MLLSLIPLLTLLPFPAHADGGAPNLAYVAGAGDGVQVFDIGLQKLIHNFSVAGNPSMALLSLDGSILYITQPTLGQVSELAARTGRVLCTTSVPGHPTLLTASADDTRLYIAGGGSTGVTVMDTATCNILQTYATNEAVSGLAVTAVVAPDDNIRNQLWIAGTTALTVITEQEQQSIHIAIPGGPRYICLPGGLTAYVTTRQGSVVAVDMSSYQVFSQLLTGGIYGPMDYDGTTGQIYIPDQRHNTIDILSPVHMGTLLTPHEPERVLSLNATPQSIAITSDGLLGFIALRDGQVSMLNVPTHQLMLTFTVGGSPQFIITGLYPPTTDPPVRQSHTSSPLTTAIIILIGLIALVLIVIGGWFLRKRHTISHKSS